MGFMSNGKCLKKIKEDISQLSAGVRMSLDRHTNGFQNEVSMTMSSGYSNLKSTISKVIT